MIELKDFKLICRIAKVIVICLAWVFICKFFFDSYYLVKESYAALRAKYVLNDFLDLKSLGDNYVAFFPYLKEQFNLFCMLVFRELILGICYYLWNRIVIPSRWIANWHANQEIHPLLGRYIVGHLREHRYLNIKDFMHLYHWERICRQYIRYHAKNPHLQDFLAAHDPDWQRDKDQN